MIRIVLLILLLSISYIYKDNFNIEEFNSYVKTIPKKVHQIYLQGYDEIPDCAKSVIIENKTNNPDYEFILYDMDMIKNYIKKYTTEDVYEAFKLINTNCKACIADFFRYVVIYNEGGIYADIKVKFKTNLNDWVNNNNKIKLSVWPWTKHSYLNKFYPNEYKVKSKYKEINQSVLVYPPKHEILKDIIIEMIKIIKHKHNNPHEIQSVLNITGPHLYTKIIAPKLNDTDYELSYHKDGLFDNKIEYDGTKGCYHDTLKSKNLKWSQLKDKIIC